MKPEIYLLTAVRNDWESLSHLLSRIDLVCADRCRLRVLVVDDASTDPMPRDLCASPWTSIDALERLVLSRNVGHQKAMAVGLGFLARRGLGGAEGVLLMDSDGEDPPERIPELVGAAKTAAAVVAARGKRAEGWKAFYGAFKLLFRCATGERLDFGNFMFLSTAAAEKLAYSPHTGEHVAASLLKSGIPRVAITVDRGSRYAGKSKMSFAALLRHGIAALSVFREVVFVRALYLIALYGILSGLVLGWGGQWTLFFAALLGVLFAPAFVFSLLVSLLLLPRGRDTSWVPALGYEGDLLRVESFSFNRS